MLDVAQPVAPLVGPFVRSPFLSVLWRHHGPRQAIRHLVGSEAGAVPFQLADGGLSLLGPQNLTDYRSPVGAVEEVLVETFGELASGTTVSLDSLPLEAAEVFATALESVGIDVTPKEHESAAVLSLPGTFDDYMTAIGKKERHETRRKRRRLTEELGEPRVVTYDQPGPALVRFFELHRLASGDKGTFMTSSMMAFFTDLLAMPGWQLDSLQGDDHQTVAAVVSHVDDDGYYLYNGAYDPSLYRLAPGVILLNSLIERSIGAGHRVFDFLKGDETYKYRMGAEARPLYSIEATI